MTDQPPDPGLPPLLQATERARLRSLVDADIATTDALHADDYQLITSGGATLSKAAYLAGIADGSLNHRRLEAVGEERVRMLGSSGPAVRYGFATDIRREGGEDSGPFWHSDTHELREGRWLAVWLQATRIPTA